MASGTRGKLLEQLEGIHRDCEWIKQHCATSIGLLPPEHQSLKNGFGSLIELANALDKFASELYSHI